MPNLKLFPHEPAFLDRCEGCETNQPEIKDIEVQSKSGRQVLRTFLCPPCRIELAQLFAKEAGL